MNVNIRLIDVTLHLVAAYLLRTPYALLPDSSLLFLIGEREWVSDRDWRMRSYYFLHRWIVVLVIYHFFGWRAALGWTSHLIIDQISH